VAGRLEMDFVVAMEKKHTIKVGISFPNFPKQEPREGALSLYQSKIISFGMDKYIENHQILLLPHRMLWEIYQTLFGMLWR
jgi:hypothetical protein